MAQIGWHRAVQTCAELGLYDPRSPAVWQATALLPAPWWSERTRAALETSRHSLSIGDRVGAREAVHTIQLDASADPELRAQVAAARVRAGDARGALDAAVGIASVAPWCQTAHMVIATALAALGDQASAQHFIDETQNVCPLVRAESGVVQNPRGGRSLEALARFVVSGASVSLECTIEVSTGARPGFTNLPVAIVASIEEVEAAHATLRAPGERVALVLHLPAQAKSRVVTLRWRGALGGLLPEAVTPQWVQLEAFRLSLSSSPAAD
jgi:hypothetical protein